MNAKKILALLLGAMMLLSLAACGAKDNDKQADMSGDGSAMTGEPKNAEEALALHKKLLEQGKRKYAFEIMQLAKEISEA